MGCGPDSWGYPSRPIPAYAWEHWEAAVRVDEKILSSVVFIGLGGPSDFTAHGTGFLASRVTDGFVFQHIVTAAHVVRPLGERAILRLNHRDGNATYLTHPNWHYHPDDAVDLAVAPVSIPRDEFAAIHVSLDRECATDEVIERENIGIGDDLITAGLFTRHLGVVSNRPVVRAGIISMMPNEPVLTNQGLVRAYLVEARSIGGLSGSPVFVQMAPYRIWPGGKIKESSGKTMYLLGVMLGYHVTSDATDIATPEARPFDANTGLGVVVPCDRVMEVTDLPPLKESREQIAANQKKESGYRPASAAREPLAAEPGHQERFNALVNG